MLTDAAPSVNAPGYSSKVSLWASLGPSILLLTGWVMLLKIAHQFTYVPLIAPLGVPLCLIWKWKGLFWSSVALLLATLWSVWGGSSHEIVWELGVAFAIFLAF